MKEEKMANFVSMSSYKTSETCRIGNVVHCQITISCQTCKAPLGGECLLTDKKTGKNLFDPKGKSNYFRIVFGVHPSKLTGSPMPAIFTPVYICNDCVAKYDPIGSLFRIAHGMGVPGDWIGIEVNVSTLRQKDGGFWITVWGNKNGWDVPPFWNGQFDLATFLAIIEKIAEIPNNPFRIYYRKT